MPNHDEDTPRLAEIARTLADFRNEFRNVMSEMVRKDVYGANMASIQMQIDGLKAENKRVVEDMERERLDRASDRREVRKAMLTAVFSGVVAVGLLLLEVVIK